MTVSYIHFDKKPVPYIRLSGAWLKSLGFQTGQKVIVREQPGILVIQLAEEADL
ncbi:MAG: type I toxin-antitoxin system SymE family toxin [Firmicutes bacterium]|nr:type I toxin-antitoxin system SymE family toxin [Bacillota bacterium]